MSLVAIKLLRRVPERRYKWEALPSDESGQGEDEEATVGGGGQDFPMVLVQIPMYNEREVRCSPWCSAARFPLLLLILNYGHSHFPEQFCSEL
jgi:hypothetical protein